MEFTLPDFSMIEKRIILLSITDPAGKNLQGLLYPTILLFYLTTSIFLVKVLPPAVSL